MDDPTTGTEQIVGHDKQGRGQTGRQQGRTEREGESYASGTSSPPSDARTKVAIFVTFLLIHRL